MAAAIDAGPAVDDTADATPGVADAAGRAAAAATPEAADLGVDDGRGFLTGSPPTITLLLDTLRLDAPPGALLDTPPGTLLDTLLLDTPPGTLLGALLGQG